MVTHVSATMREQTPHTINSTNNQTISEAVKRRAQSVIKDKSIDAGTRAWIRYGLEINDPWLPELVRRVDAGESIFDNLNVPLTTEEKIEALAEIICRAGNEASAALLVLMATMETVPHPRALANVAKHFALTRCLDSNLYGIVDTQIATIENELLASNSCPV